MERRKKRGKEGEGTYEDGLLFDQDDALVVVLLESESGVGAGCSAANDDDISFDDFGGVDGRGMYAREAGNYDIDLVESFESHCDFV